MKVVNTEARGKTFAGFCVGVIVVFGGVLTTAAFVDRILHEGITRVNKAQGKSL
jgi:hypothetical protein